MVKDKAIKEFWNWFLKNEHLFYFGTENENEREILFNKISSKLKNFNETVVYEFSPIRNDNTKEFCISADGMKDAFDVVKRIVEFAPKHEHWEFTAFRQRIESTTLQIKMGDLKIGYDDIFFRYAEDEDGFGVELNIRNFSESGREKNAIFILMDSLLGEYDVVMEINWIDWVKLDEANIENFYPFIELRNIVDRRKENKKENG